MRIVIVHNEYRTAGGEESVVQSESDLLRKNGHMVVEAKQSSSSIITYSLPQRLLLLRNMSWSQRSYETILRLVSEYRADIVHVHNSHPLWSPSVFAAAHDGGAATVLTLHNYRLLCMNGLLVREGKACTECLNGRYWRGIVHRCGQQSVVVSAAMAKMMYDHDRRRTWAKDVDAFIALTENNAKQTFAAAGIPPDRVHVKANFLDDPWQRSHASERRYGALFIGQLTEIKGAARLLRAWQNIDYPLCLVGKGPLEPSLRAVAPPTAQFAGELPLAAILDLLSRSSFVVFPSVAREQFPRVIVEAFAMGRPVVCSRHGAMAEIVRHNQTGLLYEPNDITSLREQVLRLIREPTLAVRLGRAARSEYLERYSAPANYQRLIEIYESARRNRSMSSR